MKEKVFSKLSNALVRGYLAHVIQKVRPVYIKLDACLSAILLGFCGLSFYLVNFLFVGWSLTKLHPRYGNLFVHSRLPYCVFLFPPLQSTGRFFIFFFRGAITFIFLLHQSVRFSTGFALSIPMHLHCSSLVLVSSSGNLIENYSYL